MATRQSIAGEIINIGPDEEFVEISQLAETIADLLDFPLEPVYVDDRPQEVRLATCSANKARELLGYKTTVSLRDGLAQMIDFIKLHQPQPFKYHLDLEIINDLTPKTWSDRLF